MDFYKAKEIFIPKEFPFSEVKYKNTQFIIIEIKTKLLIPSVQRQDMLDYYTKIFEEKKEVDPIWCSMGRVMRNGSLQCFQGYKPQINDGNHRAKAAQLCNIEFIKAIMPENHYLVYKDLYENN